MMTLIDIVSSKRKAEILRLLFGVESGELHLREIVRRSRLALGTVQQELARLVKIGLVNSRRDGNRVYYRANRNSPVYADIRNLVLKTTGLANVLRCALQQPDVQVVFVFGSVASETAGPGSDIDLMVIGDIGLRRVAILLSGMAAKLGREINPHVLTAEEFGKRKQTGDHFISSVLATPRLFIVGSEHELAELAK
jgi:DNA-binding transcriptional ArsR family regulator